MIVESWNSKFKRFPFDEANFYGKYENLFSNYNTNLTDKRLFK